MSQLEGLDEEGARILLAGLLALDPGNLPESAPLAADLELVPVP